MNHAMRSYAALVELMHLPLSFRSFFRADTGKLYGVRLPQKLALAAKMKRNTRRIPSATHYLEHLVMATTLLEIPPAESGCVVECGTYKGGSATNLSLVCSLVNRELEIFDSFAGLPHPSSDDHVHTVLDKSQRHSYRQGDWHGSQDEVRATIARYGELSVATLHPGYFDETLPHFEDRCVLIFLDVDLRDSLETCLKSLWPLLSDGGYVFTHEARHIEVSSLFFDRAWWREELACEPPGLVGAGSGLGLIPSGKGFRSDLAYTVKNPAIGGFSPRRQPGLAS